MLNDHEQRLKATTPGQSFIVQAPAGSGKTELLTQRYLRLLSRVSAPEQIIALTFTKKAASEMRERILAALNRAAHTISPRSDHQALTHEYALAALQQSERLNWQLLSQPSRLRVITIDALCQSLIHAIPFHEKQIPYATISNKPNHLYLKAIRACISDALSQPLLQPLSQALLNHLDNRQDKLIALLNDLLIKREQWLSTLYNAREYTQTMYEEALAFIIQHELDNFIQDVPVNHRDNLCELCTTLAKLENNPLSPRYLLKDWLDFSQLTSELGTALSALLLTKDNKLRKSFDHHVGLKRGMCPDKQYSQLKADSKALLEKLNENSNFLNALLRIKKLPSPHYTEEQWAILQALLKLLPLLVAHLHLVFEEANSVDFTTVAQQALLALGDEQNPTDLALYLDNAIHHLLVDEFQDTSIQQFYLITQLVQGWLPDESKTLFIVGDPMQSIYRFRQAEVGLFLKAKQQGIGAISLEFLELSCNFRSTPTLVNWVNSHFKTIFPAREDIESGAVTFHSSEPTRDDLDSSIESFEFIDKYHEANELSNYIVQLLDAYPDDTIAILVRSRSQLATLIKVLRKKDIPFQGVDIEKLNELDHIKDVWSLTQALLMPANRLAWLSLLRAPWAGIALIDLYHLANFDKKRSIYYAMANVKQLANLSEEGLIRIQFIYNVLHHALANRHQHKLTEWIIEVLKQLNSACCYLKNEQTDLEQFFNLLSNYENAGLILDMNEFENELKKLYSNKITSSRLQIMTIHKSKGLEFDTVILPALGNKSKSANQPLLRWMKLPSAYSDNLHLLSPIQAVYNQPCSLYNYLGDIAAEKERYEQQRLLYVATTRAKKRLYLSDYSSSIRQGTFRQLLSKQPFASQMNVQENDISTPPSSISLQRLPLSFYQETKPNLSAAATTSRCIDLYSSSARQIGIIAHELLQWICTYHPPSSAEIPWSLINNRLITAGLAQVEINESQTKLQHTITAMFNDPIGHWIFQAHANEHNEYEVLSFEGNQVKTHIIDRIFYDNGVCWIIDFKTGKEDEIAKENHYKQLTTYANLLRPIIELPIKCGVYYLTTNLWLNWADSTVT